MNTDIRYRVISKSSNSIRIMVDPKRVSDFMLARFQMGRGFRHYIVIKSDKQGDRIVNLNRSDSKLIEQALEAA